MICVCRLVEDTGYLIQSQIKIAEETVENCKLLREGQGKGARFGSRECMNIVDGVSWYSVWISRIGVVKDARGRSMIEEAMMGKWDDESLAIFRVNVMWRIKSRNFVWLGSFCWRKLCRFEIFSFIWSACGHCNSCSEGLHTLRSIRQGGSSHWHCTDTRIVSRCASHLGSWAPTQIQTHTTAFFFLGYWP
jgi:hypothetical protein